MKNKIDYEILNKRVEYLIEKLDSLEDFVNFDPADFLKRLTKVEAMLRHHYREIGERIASR